MIGCSRRLITISYSKYRWHVLGYVGRGRTFSCICKKGKSGDTRYRIGSQISKLQAPWPSLILDTHHPSTHCHFCSSLNILRFQQARFPVNRLIPKIHFPDSQHSWTSPKALLGCLIKFFYTFIVHFSMYLLFSSSFLFLSRTIFVF